MRIQRVWIHDDMNWGMVFRVVSSWRRGLDVLKDCAGQSMFLDGSDGQGGRTTRSREQCEVGRRFALCLGVGGDGTGRRRATSECVPRKR